MAKQGGWLHKVAPLLFLPVATGAADSALPIPPTTIGLNLSTPAYFRQTRVFSNLLLGASPWLIGGGQKVGTDDLDRDGNLKRLPPGKTVFKQLVQPTEEREATIRCTFAGRGTIRPAMAVEDVHLRPDGFTFHWRNTGYRTSQIQLRISSIDPNNPIRNLDCRDTGLSANARFSPAFLAFLRPFKVLRFMDWQNTNDNETVSWTDRHTSSSIDVLNQDGVSIEDMMDLVNQTGADPWFSMPWNADDDYIHRFAQYVHDHLPPGRKVYVEPGNEVWNARFPMSKQALREGVAEGLSPDPETARLYRYAERLAQVMKIWSRVFADRPRQLVRVANCQNGPNRSKLVLAYKDTAQHVDALATAPYFGFDFRKNPPSDPAEAFARMSEAMDKALDVAASAKAVAAAFGKRYIAYEAGQHIVLKDEILAQKIQRDPRMYDAYRRYLQIWRTKIGDTIMMYESIQPIVRTGAWGLVEYLGQPLDEAPKMRAVLDSIPETRH